MESDLVTYRLRSTSSTKCKNCLPTTYAPVTVNKFSFTPDAASYVLVSEPNDRITCHCHTSRIYSRPDFQPQFTEATNGRKQTSNSQRSCASRTTGRNASARKVRVPECSDGRSQFHSIQRECDSEPEDYLGSHDGPTPRTVSESSQHALASAQH